MILISAIWSYFWCVFKNSYYVLVVGCETSKYKAIFIYMHHVLKKVPLQKNIRHFQYFKWILELQRIVLCYEIHLPCITKQPIGTLWNTCFHKNIHIAYYQEWQIKTSNINLYKFCSISTKFQLKCFIYLYNTIWVVHQDSV